MKLTLIGNGMMAKSLAKGLSKTYDLEIIGRDEKSLKELKEELPDVSVKVMGDKEDISDKIIIFCVKPYALQSVAVRLIGKAKVFLSILAGTNLETLKKNIDATHYVRTMPNIAASNQMSMTTITGDKEAKNLALELFNAIGKTVWVNTENQLDIATAVAGSGPAYLALVAEAIADGAVKAGLERHHSKVLVQGLFQSVASLLENNSPSQIKDSVMSPGGTTSQGYAALEEASTRSAFIKAIEKAHEKAIELSKE